MENRLARSLALGLAVSLALFFSHVVSGELVPRLVVDPKPAGLFVSLDSVASESGTARLIVTNHSTVLLSVDGARSSFITPDGQVHQLSSRVSNDFTNPLLPGESASGTLGGLGALESGSRLEVRLVWTLGAVVGSATWAWKMEDASTPVAPQTPAPVPSSTSTPAQAGTSQAGATESANSDSLIGLVAIAAGLVILALLGWGLWSLLS